MASPQISQRRFPDPRTNNKIALWREDEEQKRRPYVVVRYEDLVAAPEATLCEFLPKIGLEVSKFDFDKLGSMEIYGSSAHRGGESSVHWAPVPKTPDFDPINRAQHWSQNQLASFNRLTEGISAELGY